MTRQVKVAQASFRWQKINKFIDELWLDSPKFIKNFRGMSLWLWCLIIAIAMILWNWQLVLATSIGLAVMLLVYLLQKSDWHKYRSQLRQLLSGSNRHVATSVIGGGMAAFSTYMAVSIWLETQQHWMATGIILQCLGTLAVLSLLVWQLIGRQSHRDMIKIDRLLLDLTDIDPLKRLIAVRLLSRLSTDPRFSRDQKIIIDSFRLMVNQEKESVIRDAILDSLQNLGNTPLLAKGSQPLSMSVNIKRSPVKIHRQFF